MAFSRFAYAAVICAAAVAAVGAIALLSSPASAANRTGVAVPAGRAVYPSNSPTCDPSRPHASGTSVETMVTSFGTRSYRLHVPTGYTGATAVPLVLNFHGATLSAAQQEAYTSFSPKADAEGFIVVYPQGVTTSTYSFTHFNAWQLSSPEPDDVAFTSQLLDTLEIQLCIDANRVFSTGLSNGAMMSVRLACSLSNRIAAIAPVAGAYYPPLALDLNAAETCPDTRPVPVIAFHGTSDTIVPYNGGPGGIPGFMITFRLPIDDNTSAEDVIADWSAHNGCTGARLVSNVSIPQVDKITYDMCDGGATVELYRVNGGGHTWPDAADIPSLGKTTHAINATNLIWTFFQAHPLGPPKAAAVGGVAGLPEVAASPVEAVGGSSSRAGFVAGAALAVAMAVALGGAAWWLRGRRPTGQS